jgi:hypothetical protein
MRVVELTQEHEDGYERFLERNPAALLYHGLRFRDFVTRLLGCGVRYAIVLRGADVVGTMPVMVADGAYGTVLNSLPYFGSNGGVLVEDPEARSLLTDWYVAQLAEPGVAAATVIENPLAPEPPPGLPRDLEDERVGHITPLAASDDPDELVRRSIDGSARRNIQKAIRAGVTVDLSDDGMEILERLHTANMQSVGGRAKAPEFFKLIPDYFRRGEDYNLYVARVDGTAVAALLVFYFGHTVEYYIPATDLEFRPVQPMAAVLLRAMSDAAAMGFRNWNWGGSWTDHESLIRFKAKWGGQPHVYRYSTRLRNHEILSATPEQLLAAYPGFYVVPFSAIQAASPPQ